MRKLILMAAAGVLLAAPAATQAQSHQHGTPAAPAAKEHDCPMHQKAGQAGHDANAAQGMKHGADAAHRYMPKMIMQHAEMLKLSADQVTELERIQAAHEADCKERMAGIKASDEAAAALLEQPTVDMAQYETQLREAADLKVKCRVGMVAAGQQARALLTAEQLAHLSHMNHAGH
jgi:Spy/CpxP family protein refolding chaperone